MRKSRFPKSQRARIPKKTEAVLSVSDPSRENAINATTHYRWNNEFGGKVRAAPLQTRNPGL